jgi:hypothetical protein
MTEVFILASRIAVRYLNLLPCRIYNCGVQSIILLLPILLGLYNCRASQRLRIVLLENLRSCFMVRNSVDWEN